MPTKAARPRVMEQAASLLEGDADLPREHVTLRDHRSQQSNPRLVLLLRYFFSEYD
jgi:hypothetical protein